MSGSPGNGRGRGPPDGRGPPEDTPGRGPPKRVRERFERASRGDGGTINVSDEPLTRLAQDVDWDNLTPFQEYVLAVLEENDLLPDE